jgi:hypothetical protein
MALRPVLPIKYTITVGIIDANSKVMGLIIFCVYTHSEIKV